MNHTSKNEACQVPNIQKAKTNLKRIAENKNICSRAEYVLLDILLQYTAGDKTDIRIEIENNGKKEELNPSLYCWPKKSTLAQRMGIKKTAFSG